MGAQNFHFAHKFPENFVFQRRILHFWTKIFRQLSDGLNVRRRDNNPLPCPPCHDATDEVGHEVKIVFSFPFSTDITSAKEVM